MARERAVCCCGHLGAYKLFCAMTRVVLSWEVEPSSTGHFYRSIYPAKPNKTSAPTHIYFALFCTLILFSV